MKNKRQIPQTRLLWNQGGSHRWGRKKKKKSKQRHLSYGREEVWTE
jgi:hypothetical protein